MIRNVLSGIDGVAAYPLMALGIFVLVFAGAIAWALSLRRSDVEHARRLPFEDGERVADGNKEHRR